MIKLRSSDLTPHLPCRKAPPATMTSTTKSCLCTRQRGFIISGDPAETVSGLARGLGGHASAGSAKEQTNQTNQVYKYPNIQRTQQTQDKPKATKTEQLEIIQTNLHKSKAATSLLAQTMQYRNEGIHIALITEPHSYGGKIQNINCKGYTVAYPRTELTPRTCIVISNRLTFTDIPELHSRDTIALLVETEACTGKKETIFASIYQSPEYDNLPPTENMTRVIQYAKNKRIPLIIGCDTNGHHYMWGSKKPNKRGRSLAEYITSENLKVANEGNTPTFSSANGETIIDVTITTSNIIDKIKDWQVLEEESLSDHRYITFQVTSETELKTPRINLRRTNWKRYRTELMERTRQAQQDITTTEELERQITNLTEAMNIAVKIATPNPRQKKNKNRNATWWTKELADLRKRTNTARKKHQSSREQEDYEAYRTLQRKYTNMVKKEKRRGWQRFTTNIEKLHEAQRLTKILDKGPMPHMSLLTRPDGTNTETTEETLRHLLDTHFPDNKAINTQTEAGIREHNQSTQSWQLAKEIITKEKLEWATKQFQPYKSPGPDQIFPIMLQKSIDIIGDQLEHILTACLVHGYMPETWRTSKVIFIPKPGKETYDKAKSYRPISLTSFLLKTMERIIDRYLRDNTLTKYKIHPNQHAYQIGKSTETALHQLVSKAEKAIENKEYALGAFFDIQGAFDNAPSEVIIKALKNRECPEQIVNWTSQLLKTRKVMAAIGKTSMTVEATKGCPQGGVLSPLMWCLVVDDLLTKLNNKNIYTQAYSDDGTILIEGKDLNKICRQMQEGLTIVNDWCIRNGLSISPEKTELVLFTRKRKTDGWITPKIGTKEIAMRTEVKYLGVILDKKLNFNAHVHNRCTKATRALFQMKRAIGKNWGYSPKITKWLYTTIIKPMICYASVIWWERATYQTTQKELAKIQRLITLSITGALRTTPSIALDSVTGLLPLHIQIIKEAMESYARMAACGEWNTNEHIGHNIIKELTTITTGIREGETDKTKRRHNLNRLFNKERDNTTTTSYKSTYRTTSSTDGEAMTTSGHTCPYNNQYQRYKLGKQTTQTLGELYAIKELCNMIKESEPKETHITITCEHTGTLHALLETKTDSKVAITCVEKLNEIAETATVTIIHRSQTHRVSNKGNSNTECTKEPKDIPIAHSTIKRKILSWAEEQHRKEFINYKGGDTTKQNISGPNTHTMKGLMKQSRTNLSILTQILSGHAKLEKHLYKIGIKDSPICKLCNEEEEDINHFIYKCKSLEATRTEIFGTTITPETHPIKTMNRRTIIRYCKETDKLT